MKDRFEDLRTFVAVAEARCFVKAAGQLGVVKSAISRRIQELEDRLGARLLNRSTRGVSLTDTGRTFFERATVALAALEEAEGAASHEATKPVGNLRILAPASFGRLHLMPIVCNFLEQHDRLSIDVSLNDEVVDLVAEGFDMAVRIGRLPDSNLSARSLGPIRRIACASPSYIARFGAPKQPSELAFHQGIQYTNVEPHKFWRFLDPRTGREESVSVRSRLRVNTGDALCQAALSGVGITVLPTFIVHRLVASRGLIPVMLPFEKVPAELHVVFPSRKPVPAKVRAFVDFLASKYTQHLQWERDVFGVGA